MTDADRFLVSGWEDDLQDIDEEQNPHGKIVFYRVNVLSWRPPFGHCSGVGVYVFYGHLNLNLPPFDN